MATISERLPFAYEEIAEQASDVRVGRALATAFTAIFIAIGWIVGRVIYGIVLLIAAIRYGYRQGAKIRRVPAEPQRPAGDGLNKV
jgi:hypothetical protein